MADNNSIVPRSPSKDAAVTDVVLNVAHDSSFRYGSERQDITDHESGLPAAVHELAGVHALGGDEQLILLLVAEGVAEGDPCERGTTTGIVDDLGDDALEIAVAFAEVETAEPGRTLAVVGMGLEDGPGTLTLSSDHATHGRV